MEQRFDFLSYGVLSALSFLNIILLYFILEGGRARVIYAVLAIAGFAGYICGTQGSGAPLAFMAGGLAAFLGLVIGFLKP